MRRPLPPWTPLALALVALASIPLLFQVPRTSQAADTLLEALPFAIAAAALVSVRFSQPGNMRRLGAIAGVIVLFAPLWWPVALGAVEEASAPPTRVTFRVHVVPEDENATYDLLVPLPLDEMGRVPQPLQDAPGWERRVRVEVVDGTPMLRVQAQGVLDRPFSWETPDNDEGWLHHRWNDDALAFGNVETTARLVVTLELEGRSRWCGGTTTLTGLASPEEGASFLRTFGDVACA